MESAHERNPSLVGNPRDLPFAQQRELQQNLLSDINLAEKLCEEDRIGEGFFLLRNIDQFLLHLNDDARGRLQHRLDNSESILKLRAKGAETLKLLELFGSKDEWNVWNFGIGPHNDISVATHKDEKKGEYFFKLDGNLRCNMIEACAAILENDLYGIWSPLCKTSKAMGSLSICRRIMELGLEFVLLKRKAVCDM